MSRITYIWGAGASYGERKKDENEKIIEFIRGLPVVNEIERAIELLQHGGRVGPYFPAEEAKSQGLSTDQYNFVQEQLTLLKKACVSYPTIDTLAKQLYVTRKFFQPDDKSPMLDYDGLKKILSVALLMMQSEKKRDLRYDGFIASLIDKMRNFPPMTILSWNYDAQFELAYAGYAERGKYIPYQWGELNVFNKMYPTEFHPEYNFAMFKLNGTAFVKDSSAEKWEVNGMLEDRVMDCFFGGRGMTPFQYGYKYLYSPHCQTLLSYAWEENNKASLLRAIGLRVKDTEELIIIGYSFPYVNDEIDRFMIGSMPNLKKVVVQDMNFDDIKERIEGILDGKEVEIVHKKNLSQFYIPNRF